MLIEVNSRVISLAESFAQNDIFVATDRAGDMRVTGTTCATVEQTV